MPGRRRFIATSSAAFGALGLSACGGELPPVGPPRDPVLKRPILDAHVHVFTAKDLPGYQFIVQSFIEAQGNQIPVQLRTLLHAFADAVTDHGPDYRMERSQLATPTPHITPPLWVPLATAVESLARGKYDGSDPQCSATRYTILSAEGQKTLSRNLRSTFVLDADVKAFAKRLVVGLADKQAAPAEAAAAESSLASNVDQIQYGLKWIVTFMKYRYERVQNWLSLIGRTGDSRFAMPAMVDYGYSLIDEKLPDVSFVDQIRLMGEISRRQPSDVLVHGYVPFNPWRFVREANESMKLLDDALTNQGFIGVKIYPPMGFRAMNNARLPPDAFRLNDTPSCRVPADFPANLDQAMWTLYAYCDANDVPIMLHSSPTNLAKFGWGERVDPAHWQPVLERYPKLRLNFGHFGGAFDLEKYPEAQRYALKIIELMKVYPNVYADLADYDLVVEHGSASPSKQYRQLHQFLRTQSAANPQLLGRRLLFGTDWEMLAREPGYERFPESMLAFLADAAGGSVNDYAAANGARFLGLDDDGGQTVDRLHAFHPPGSSGRKMVDEFRSLAKGTRIASRD